MACSVLRMVAMCVACISQVVFVRVRVVALALDLSGQPLPQRSIQALGSSGC